MLDGKEINLRNTQDAQALGISIIHQEINLMQDLTVSENIFIGREPMRGFILNKTLQDANTNALLDSLHLRDIRANTRVRTLTVAKQQMVEIGFVDALINATPEESVVIAVISQEAVSGSIVGRTTGFVERMVEVASAFNTVSVTGHDLWKNEVEDAGIIVHVQISATTEATDVATASNAVLNMDNLKAVFLSNEGAVTGFLADPAA